jgi:predicted flap endonuclease-1-like 5' DNA nuclease
MKLLIQIFILSPEYFGIFILMLSAFLIGYFSSWKLQKLEYKELIKKLKKKINILKEANNVPIRDKNINDIDSLFIKIKPRIIEVVQETQEKFAEAQTQKNDGDVQSPKNIAEKTRTSYITYTKTKPQLNFDNFGHASSDECDDLTKIIGIGPYIEQKLNEISVYKYDQISKFTFEDIRIVTELIDFFPGRIERDDWVGQANSLKVH